MRVTLTLALSLAAVSVVAYMDGRTTFGDEYRVIVDTSKHSGTAADGPGTDEHVHLLLSAPGLDVIDRYLDNPDHNDFERGSKDEFAFAAPRISPNKVGVRLVKSTDDTNWQWKISYITIENLTRQKTVARVHWDNWIDELDTNYWYDVKTEKIRKEGEQAEEDEDWYDIKEAGFYIQMCDKQTLQVTCSGPYKSAYKAEEAFAGFMRTDLYKWVTRPFWQAETPELLPAYSARPNNNNSDAGFYVQTTQKWTGTRFYSGPFATWEEAAKEAYQARLLGFTHIASGVTSDGYSFVSTPFYWNKKPDSDPRKLFSGLRFLP